jgi:hypothetical protein
MALFSQATSPRSGLRSLPADGPGGTVARRAPVPVRAPIARPVSPPSAPTASGPFSRNPIFGPLAAKVIARSSGTAAAPGRAVPPAPVRSVSPIPVRGTSMIARPVSTITRPIAGMPTAGIAPIGGLSVPISHQPQGGTLRVQPAGAPPSGAPPSMSLVTNMAGVAQPDDGMFSNPIAIGQFSIPFGWLALGAVVVVVALAGRK